MNALKVIALLLYNLRSPTNAMHAHSSPRASQRFQAHFPKKHESVVSVHIPKTAGTTLRGYLEDNWERYVGCATVTDYSDGITRQDMLTLRSGASGNCLTTSVWNGAMMPTIFLKLVSQNVIFQYEHGHHPVGLCSFFPAGCHYTTLLRDPVDRTVSHYHYLRSLPRHLNEDVDLLADKYTSLDILVHAALRDEIPANVLYGLFNAHTLLLSGNGFQDYVTQASACNNNLHGCDLLRAPTWADVETAKRNLKTRFKVIGMTSNILEYGTLMKLTYGYPYTDKLCTHANVNAFDLNSTRASASLRDKIRNLNKYDIAVYEYAMELYHSQKQTWGRNFEDEHKRTVAACVQKA